MIYPNPFDVMDPNAPANAAASSAMGAITDAVGQMPDPMAMSGELNQSDTSDVDSQISEIMAQLNQVEQQPKAFDQNFENYRNRLSGVFTRSPRPTIFDLASDLGASLLADTTQDPYAGLGRGFSQFNKRFEKNKKERIALDQQIGMKAMEMALTDERNAEKYLNERLLRRIELSGKPFAPLIYEVDELGVDGSPTGKRVQVQVDPRNISEVQAIKSNPSAKLIRGSQVNINQSTSKPSEFDKGQGKNLAALFERIHKDYDNARNQNDLTNSFLSKLNELGKDNFGILASNTLGARKFLSEFGITLGKNIKDQELINTLGTRIAMGLVGQTKGAITEMEMNLFIAASPSLASSYEGAILQATYLQRIANMKMKVSEEFNDAVANGLLDGADTQAKKYSIAKGWEQRWHKKNRLFTPEEMQELRNFATEEPDVAKALREEIKKDQNSLKSTDTAVDATGDFK
tara:strand:- start:413 stop:1795 length:1383 start_codon:yes stop_codon:yes gene_type:complete